MTAELLELHEPEIVFTQASTQPEGAQFHQGREQLREAWETWFEVWEHHRSEPRETRERGDRVLVLSQEHFRTRDGGEFDHKGAAIFTFQGSSIVRIDSYTDHDTARREFEQQDAR